MKYNHFGVVLILSAYIYEKKTFLLMHHLIVEERRGI